MNITATHIETIEAGQQLGTVTLVVDFGDADQLTVSGIRILKSDTGPVATLCPEFAGAPRTFFPNMQLEERILTAAVNAYRVRMAELETAEPKAAPVPTGINPHMADARAEREAYFAKYSAHARNAQKWAAFRREWKARKEQN